MGMLHGRTTAQEEHTPAMGLLLASLQRHVLPQSTRLVAQGPTQRHRQQYINDAHRASTKALRRHNARVNLRHRTTTTTAA